MKKPLLCLFLSFLFLFSAGQDSTRNAIFTFGASYNLVGIEDSDQPGLDLMFDRAINDYFSVGLAFNYTDMRAAERFNFSMRPLFHTGISNRSDVYIGLRFGASYWDVKGQQKYSNDLMLFSVKDGSVYPSVQTLLGWRMVSQRGVGVNVEGALGSPYFFFFGLTLDISRFNNRVQKGAPIP